MQQLENIKNSYTGTLIKIIEKILEESVGTQTEKVQLFIEVLHQLFTDTRAIEGYRVRNFYLNGNELDLLQNVSKEDWDEKVYDNECDSVPISFFDLEASKNTFLKVLGSEFLTYQPTEYNEDLKNHLLSSFNNVFNGNNFYSVRFGLDYLEYQETDSDEVIFYKPIVLFE